VILRQGLSWVGLHARLILLGGLVVVPLLPASQGAFTPALPLLVALLLALAVARLDLSEILSALTTARVLLPILAALLLFQPLLGLGLQQLGHWLGLAPAVLLVLAGFAAAPPLSSAPNLALMLGYDARLALLVTLTGTFLSPLMVPATLWLVGSSPLLDPQQIALKVSAMLLGGVLLGTVIRQATGPARIARNTQVFDGIAALVMLIFLFPLLDGALAQIQANPARAVALATLALVLNIGSNLMIRQGMRMVTDRATAGASGLLMGNRNLSVLLAALPYDPTFSLFVALSQIPIYVTPLVFSLLDGPRTPCLPSSES
jgi:hypothetical protein